MFRDKQNRINAFVYIEEKKQTNPKINKCSDMPNIICTKKVNRMNRLALRLQKRKTKKHMFYSLRFAVV